MPDISETLAPNSNQLDNIDLRGEGPKVFTVTTVDVRPGTDQPVAVHLAEFDRPWKPGKNMRRVLAHCWGRNSDSWPGKRVELFADETVKFGKETPGGTRISRLSGITKTEHAPVLLSQGKPGTYKVEPLPDTPAPTTPPSEADIAACTDRRQLWDWHQVSPPDVQALILARKTTLDGDTGAGVGG